MSTDPGPHLPAEDGARDPDTSRAGRDDSPESMSIDDPPRQHELPPSDPQAPAPPGAHDQPGSAAQSLLLQSLAAASLGALSIQEPAPATGNPSARVPANIDIQAAMEKGPALEPPPQVVATPRDVPIRDDRSLTIGAPSPYSSTSFYSPRAPVYSPPHHTDMRSPGSLPPIQPMGSPRSESNGQNALPSIREQLGDLREAIHSAHPGPMFSHPSPGTIPRLGAMNHASPPISPNDFRRDMPSPGHMLSAQSPYYYPPSLNGHHPRSTDYTSSTTETPSTEHSTPATSTSTHDRMSIDGITNPQLGMYICKVPGCTAPAFQTQYLLNSHANVHSSARPHYCPVKGCPRSEGGKGFKRKNEMIRHGLVHDSPGYVCPFCPDREHRYPRPDNLQRCVLSRRRSRSILVLTPNQTRPRPPHGQRQGRRGVARRARAAAGRTEPRPEEAGPGMTRPGAVPSTASLLLHIFVSGNAVPRHGTHRPVAFCDRNGLRLHRTSISLPLDWKNLGCGGRTKQADWFPRSGDLLEHAHRR